MYLVIKNYTEWRETSALKVLSLIYAKINHVVGETFTRITVNIKIMKKRKIIY